MALGTGIFLIVIGAVLSFGVKDNVDWVNMPVVGYIFMGVGVLALILSLIMNAQRGKTTHREVIERKGDQTPPPAAGM